MNERAENTLAAPLAARPPPASWDAFEAALADALAVLKDEFLIVSAKGTNRYVQFHVAPGEAVHAEAVHNAWVAEGDELTDAQMEACVAMGWTAPTRSPEDPASPAPGGSPNFFRNFPHPYSSAEIARFAVRTLSEVHGIPGPEALEYKAFDEPGTSVLLPVLGIDAAPASPSRAKARPGRRKPSSFARLRRTLLRTARELFGRGSLEYDGEGWLQVPVGSREGFVRAHEKPFFVRVHVELRANVEADEALLSRISRVNAGLSLARLVLVDGSIHLGVDFPAIPFVPAHLSQAISFLARVADDVDQALDEPAEAPAGPTVN